MKTVKKLLTLTVLLILTALSAQAQYVAYEQILKQGDARFQSGTTNINNKRYDAAVTDFNEAIRYYETARKAPSKPENAEATLNKKVADCRSRITQATNLKAQAAKAAQQPPAPAPTLSVSQKELRFTAADSVIILNVNTNQKSWKLDAELLPAWCEPSHSVNEKELMVTVQKNTAAKSRSCAFDIVTGNLRERIEVFQSALEITMEVNKRELNFNSDDDSTDYQSVSVVCNTDWELVNNEYPDIIGLKQEADSVLVFMKVHNAYETRRQYQFKILSGNKEETITVWHEKTEGKKNNAAQATKQNTRKEELKAPTTPTQRGQAVTPSSEQRYSSGAKKTAETTVKEPGSPVLLNEKRGFGIYAGYALKQLDVNGSNMSLNGMQAGARYDYYFLPDKLGLGLSVGLLYEMFGGDTKAYNYGDTNPQNGWGVGYAHVSESGVSIPVNALYRLDFSETMGLIIQAGVCADYSMSSKITYETGTFESLPAAFKISPSVGASLQFGPVAINVSGAIGSKIPMLGVIFYLTK
ncbi:MAG: BACON domain-containing protein [Tannerella sp.]|jgi:hypothetical protein|nr:BACON domain-containing protein [Tannerella sp.]